MKHLLFISFLLFALISWTQNEKGCTISDKFSVGYYDGETYTLQHRFCEIWPNSSTSTFSTLDTFKIAVDDKKEIKIDWSFYNEHYNMYYPMYDTAKWYYNDTLMEADGFTFYTSDYSGFCGSAYRASTSINQVKLGYYQLRYLGEGSGLSYTKFPVIHVHEVDEAGIDEEDTPTETILYPNPAKNLVNLKLSKPINKGVMQVHNLQGQLVVSYPLNNLKTTTHHDISQLNQGLYVFSIINKEDGEEILRKKVVVQ